MGRYGGDWDHDPHPLSKSEADRRERAERGQQFADRQHGYFTGYAIAQQEFEERARREASAAQAEDVRAQMRSVTEAIDREINRFLAMLRALPVAAPQVQPLAERTVFYEITRGLIARGELEPFIQIVDSLRASHAVPCTKEDIAAAFHSETPLFQAEGALTETVCGSFWLRLISDLPASPFGNGEGYPPVLFALFFQAEKFYSDFAGDGAVPLHLDEYFARHHQRYSLLTPDVEGLKDVIRQQRFSDEHYRFTRPYRDLLTASFPEAGRWWSCEKLACMEEEELLAAVYRKDAAMAVRMWRLLLDTAGDLLGKKEVADHLLGFELAGHCRRAEAWECGDRFDPILEELARDDRFARQLYQSASLRGDQMNLLIACCVRDRISLMEHLRELLRQNPCLTDSWPGGLPKWVLLLPESGARGSERARPAAAPCAGAFASAEPTKDDAREYRYCHVALEGVGTEYAYLCEDSAIMPGDFVRVPFGKGNAERVARVKRVGLYTAADAPCPPEQAKKLLGRAGSLSENAGAAVEQASEAVGQPPATPSADSAPAPAASERTETHSPAKKAKKVGLIVMAVLLTALCAVGFGIWKQNASANRAAYDEALAALDSGAYTEAQKLFADLNAYRDSASFSVYCKYAALYESRSTYTEGESELAGITLRYETDRQPQVDALARKVSAMAQTRRAAEAQAAEQQRQADLKARYGGKLPVEGMPMSCLKYTSLGEPDESVKCPDFDRLVEQHRSYALYWYDADGVLIAGGTCFQGKNDAEFVLHSFVYYDDPAANPSQPLAKPFADGGDPYHAKDYDTAEDFYEENRMNFDGPEDAEDYYNEHQ